MMAATAMASALTILASERDPPRPPAALPDAFAEQWTDDPPAASKGDRLPLFAPAPAPPVEVPPPIWMSTVADIKQARNETPRARNKPAPERDICTRHGMHKQITRGGKSWRCRR